MEDLESNNQSERAYFAHGELYVWLMDAAPDMPADNRMEAYCVHK